MTVNRPDPHARLGSVRADAVLLVSFGGPEATAEVMPFLRHVTAGREVTDERLMEVRGHYSAFGDRSPINAQARALRDELAKRLELPVVLAHRHVPPYLPGAIQELRRLGTERVLVLLSSAFPSWSGCRSYRDELEVVGQGIAMDVLPKFGSRPGYVLPFADGLREALGRRPEASVLFTAHSIPRAQARLCAYEAALRSSAALVCTAAGHDGPWELVWQSRSGPAQAWLGPDVGERIEQLAGSGVTQVIVVPLGFLSDHMEVAYDLDTDLRAQVEALGVQLDRVATPGTDHRFVDMLAELVTERIEGPTGSACEGGVSCCPRSATAPPVRSR